MTMLKRLMEKAHDGNDYHEVQASLSFADKNYLSYNFHRKEADKFAVIYEWLSEQV